MLIRFVVSNFLSFDKEVEFNMIAGSFKTHKHHVYNLPNLKLLKGSAIYGANGAGKSNLIKAIEFLQETILDGELKRSVNDKKFKLHSKKDNALPVNFEVEFSNKKKTYAYGLSLNNNTVQEEWLYETFVGKDDRMIFERKFTRVGKTSVNISKQYIKTAKDQLLIELIEENLLKGNELLISKNDNIKIKEIDILKNWFRTKLVIIFPGSKFTGLVGAIARDDKFREFANELIQSFDTGVKGLAVETMDLDEFIPKDDEENREKIYNGINEEHDVILHTNLGPVMAVKEDEKIVVKKVVSVHNDNSGKPVYFDLFEESDGTQRILDFIPAFNNILLNDMTMIIDEIDQSLHPVLLKALIEKTMGDEATNGQLVFTTHESNLLDLDIFRQDEIWFAEKKRDTNSTQLYSLSEFKPRYDLDIQKGYLKGRFGAIPFLGDLGQLKWQDCYA